MGRKAFFMESKVPPFETTRCDKCGLLIKGIQDGKIFWNPNPNANDRNICRNCYDVFQHARAEGFRKWQQAHSAIERVIVITEDEKSGENNATVKTI